MSRVSVIIPCYNAAKYINKCLDALNNQAFKDFDVIIIDDCSSDNSVEVINKLKKKYPYKILLEKNDDNRGPAVSRNKGILCSHSEYVAFCDSDDWYDSNFLKIMIESIDKYKADICLCGYKIVKDKGKTEFRSISECRKTLSPKETLQLGTDSLCMLVMKRELMLKCPWPNLRNGEDMAIVPLLICNATKCAVIPECPYNYFTRLTSSSNRLNMSVIESLIKSFEFIKQNIPNGYDMECEFIGINNLLYSVLINLFTISNDRKKAKKILLEFEAQYPNWFKNPYFKSLPTYKKLVLRLVKNRCFILLRVLANIRAHRK